MLHEYHLHKSIRHTRKEWWENGKGSEKAQNSLKLRHYGGEKNSKFIILLYNKLNEAERHK